MRHINFECGKAPKFECTVCFKSFKRKDILQRHVANMHFNYEQVKLQRKQIARRTLVLCARRLREAYSVSVVTLEGVCINICVFIRSDYLAYWSQFFVMFKTEWRQGWIKPAIVDPYRNHWNINPVLYRLHTPLLGPQEMSH